MKTWTLVLTIATLLVFFPTIGDNSIVAHPTCCWQRATDENEEKDKKGQPTAEEIAVEKALKLMAIADDKKAYVKLNKLMTASAWEEFVASRIGEATMMASQDPGGNEAIANVLKQFKIDFATPGFLSGSGMPSEEDVEDWFESLLAQLPDNAKRIELLKTLDELKSSQSAAGLGDPVMEVIEFSMYKGEVISTNVVADRASIQIKPELPEMPEGVVEMGVHVDIEEAEEMPPGAIPDGFGIEVGDGDGFAFMGAAPMDFPPVTINFKKVDGQWKCDGIEMDDFSHSHPTIEDPGFEGKTTEGKKVSLEDYRGKVVLLDFWGTWCEPCVAEIPELRKLAKALEGEDFVLVGIAQDNMEDLGKFLAKEPLPWVNVVDNGEICSQFKVNMFPTTLLIDKKGNHVASQLHGKQLINELAILLQLDDDGKQKLLKALNSESKLRKSEF